MDKERFDQQWPPVSEGIRYVNKDFVDVYLEVTRPMKTWKRLLWLVVLLFLAYVLAFATLTLNHIAMLIVAVAVYFFLILKAVALDVCRLRYETELIKGSIRENRHLLITRTAVAHQQSIYDPLLMDDDD